MRNILMYLGFIMLVLGASVADSDSLIIPTILMMLGGLILLFVSKEDYNE